ncbi:uncharacterized protein LOC127796328 [Diospyros lotus]|uniref:uncharacterized protein LOC127796328 n=1 Tax=Diospyros lotus TaxID=55363 RepID=UPI0022506C8D|nr:uncharacterized protein LOC127796328 [Diospyros lotus]
MEDEQESFLGEAAIKKEPPPSSPAVVMLTPFSAYVSPSPRRLSSRFIHLNRPVRAAARRLDLAWVSLQGRLVGAEEATSARTLRGGGGSLAPEEAMAWEMFSPIQRVLIVAVIAVAAVNSKKNSQIYRLTKSVELRDQVLSSMQEKLDKLCEQVNYFKDQQGTWDDNMFGFEKVKSVPCGCQPCKHHQHLLNDPMDNHANESFSGKDMFKYKIHLCDVEPEERRMSDLSDWAPSVTSSVDIQLNPLAIEQDINNLKKECEEKDATIKELSTFIHSSELAGSKRIAELEDIIRRKNVRITKLKKDMLVLEQKVVQLTRLQRPSSASSSNSMQLPVMADNLLYDMDSTTSSSSSDSDCPARNRPQAPVSKSQENCTPNGSVTPRRKEKISERTKTSGFLLKSTDKQQKSRPVSPLKEKPINETPDPISSLRHMQLILAGGNVKHRRREIGSKVATPQKRWL